MTCAIMFYKFNEISIKFYSSILSSPSSYFSKMSSIQEGTWSGSDPRERQTIAEATVVESLGLGLGTCPLAERDRNASGSVFCNLLLLRNGTFFFTFLLVGIWAPKPPRYHRHSFCVGDQKLEGKHSRFDIFPSPLHLFLLAWTTMLTASRSHISR